jgi:L-lactate dehydrogenase
MSSGTVLDTSRLRWLLAEEGGVSTTSVHATIVGEHGDTEFPLWSNANIGQIPLRDWTVEGRRPFTDERLDEITHRTINAAYTVIQGKGATNYAIGLSGIRIAEAILRDLRSVLPVSSILDDFHGISGLALSVPSIVGRRGVEQPLAIPMGEHEEQQLRDSAQAMRKALVSLGF